MVLWIGFSTFLLSVFAASDQLKWLSDHTFGFNDSRHFVYVICFGFLFIYAFYATIVLNRQQDEVRVLISELAILRSQVDKAQKNHSVQEGANSNTPNRLLMLAEATRMHSLYTHLTKLFPSGADLHTPTLGAQEKARLIECLDSTFVSSVGPMTVAVEERLCALTGSPHAAVTSNGTSALHLCLHALGVSANDLVIVPTNDICCYCQRCALHRGAMSFC